LEIYGYKKVQDRTIENHKRGRSKKKTGLSIGRNEGERFLDEIIRPNLKGQKEKGEFYPVPKHDLVRKEGGTDETFT